MTTKPVEAASVPATAGPYYNINEYSGQLYKWSVERLSPDNLVCLPIGCLGVLVSLVARVAEGALMLVVNACLAVKGAVWGHTATAITPPANANANTANPPATEETGKGKKAKQKEKTEETGKAKKAAKKDDVEEPSSAKKTEKTAKAGKKGSTEEVEEESELENSGKVTDTEEEEEVGSEYEGDEVSGGSDAEETTETLEINIPKIRKLDLDALPDPVDQSQPGAPSSAPTTFVVDWNKAGIDRKPIWSSLKPQAAAEKGAIDRRVKEGALVTAAGATMAATVGAPLVLPALAAYAFFKAMQTPADGGDSYATRAYNAVTGSGACKANRQKAVDDNRDDDDVSPPATAAPSANQSQASTKPKPTHFAAVDID